MLSRIDMNHATMRLSRYNAASLPYFEALNRAIKYSHHHPHVSIMYPRKQVITPSINVHYKKGEGEIVSIMKILDYSGMK